MVWLVGGVDCSSSWWSPCSFWSHSLSSAASVSSFSSASFWSSSLHTVAGVDGGGVLLDGVDGAAVDGVVGGSVVVVVAVVDDVEVDDDELLVLGIVVVVDVDGVSAGVRTRPGSDEPCSMLAAAAVTDTARDVVVMRGHCSLSAPSGPCALLQSGKGDRCTDADRRDAVLASSLSNFASRSGSAPAGQRLPPRHTVSWPTAAGTNCS